MQYALHLQRGHHTNEGMRHRTISTDDLVKQLTAALKSTSRTKLAQIAGVSPSTVARMARNPCAHHETTKLAVFRACGEILNEGSTT